MPLAPQQVAVLAFALSFVVIRVWLYSGADLQRMLTDAGFAQVQIFGHLDGRPYDLEARRLVAVASKGV